MENDRNDDMTIPSQEVPGRANVYNPQPQNVVEVPSMQEAPRYESAPSYTGPVVEGPSATYQGPVSAEPPKKSNKKTVWIIVAVVVVLLCCCCIAIVLAVNSIMQSGDYQDLQDLLDDYSLFIQVAPAYAQAFLVL
ncbi:MAG: hypothetical protein CVU39_21285 [Chloroflexi bacterium HGW-Chloroflexi-10]|nr:MAG: hypothetical protein CVU39_21285 [Chloroflexi bacterium HGW-Chloroflexi-10]